MTAVWLGVRMLFVYNGLRLFRRLVPHKRWFRDLEDVFYWLFCGLWAFAVTFYENDGQIRWFFLAGIGLGMISSNIISLETLKKGSEWVKIRKKRKFKRGRR